MNTINALGVQGLSQKKRKITKSNHLRNLLIAAISSHLMVSFAIAEPVTTLKQMVEKTISSNPEVQARYHAYLGAGYEQDMVKGGFLPKLDIQSTYRKQEDINGFRNSTGTNIPRWNNELVLRQMIFDGFATSKEVNRLSHAKRVRYYELQATMQETTLEFIRAYVDVLRYRQLAEYAKANYVTHKQLFDKIKERVDAGVARRVDADQASGRLALAEANLLTEMTNLHDVTARVQRLLGELPPDVLEHADFFKDGAQPTAVEALRVAYLQNPNLLSTIEDIQATKNEVKTKEARYLPRLDLQARKNLGTSSDGRNSTNAADVLELTMNFNLFNGFSDKASVSQTIEKLNTANDFRDKACVDTRQLVTIAYNDINQLKEQLVYRDIHQKSIENAREAYRKQFDIGQRTLLDLLDTENEYFQAKRSYINAEYDIQTAYARLYASQGELLKKIGTAREGLPEVTREAYMDAANICEAIAPAQIKVDKEALLANAKPLAMTQPLIKPAQACSTMAITNRIDAWAKSWRQKDYDTYSQFYATNFQPESPLSRDEWTKERKQRMSVSGKVNLDISNLQITCDGDKAIAKFTQDYSVTTYKLKTPKNSTGCQTCDAKRVAVRGQVSNASKELQFEKVGNQYQIVKELIN